MNRHSLQTGLLVLCALACAGCLRQKMVDVNRPIVTTDSGVSYEELLLGHGATPARGQTIALEYVCTLPDGTEVDSTSSRGQHYTYVFGEAFLEGIDEGVEGMQLGGKRRIVVPPALAYGEDGVEGLVPAGTDLVFVIELVEIAEEDDDE